MSTGIQAFYRPGGNVSYITGLRHNVIQLYFACSEYIHQIYSLIYENRNTFVYVQQSISTFICLYVQYCINTTVYIYQYMKEHIGAISNAHVYLYVKLSMSETISMHKYLCANTHVYNNVYSNRYVHISICITIYA